MVIIVQSLKKLPTLFSISSSDSFVTEAHKVITLEDEPTDPGNKPKVTCHVATGIIEEQLHPPHPLIWKT